MGWDAIAVRKDSFDLTNEDEKAFKEASDKVKKLAGSVDFGLDTGYLDVEECGKMIHEATGQSIYSYEDWTPDRVKLYYKDPGWNRLLLKIEEDYPQSLWTFHSAKEFMRVCSERGLGIHFHFRW